MYDVLTQDSLEKSLGVLAMIYDVVRVIDPLKKKVVDYRGGKFEETASSCVEFWNTGKICPNCISLRAYKEKQTMFKLECRGNDIFTVMAIPVMTEGNTIVLEVIKNISHNMSIDNNLNMDSEVLKILSVVNQLQIKDSLTGLYNRRFIDERIPVELINSSEQSPFCIIMADIDHFKKVNDSYGHVVGDFVLKEFAKLLQCCMAEYDGWVARYGGEEFLVCVKDIDVKKAGELAEDMRKLIEATTLRYEELEINITSSFGVTEHKNLTDITTEKLVDKADKNLYEAKNAGRNKVVAV